MTVAIIGLGLIGGSLGLALRSHGYRVIGCSRTSETTARALARSAIDRAASSPEEAAAEAHMVILATPVLAIEGVLRRIAPVLRPGTLVTDTASTKRKVMAWAEQYLPRGAEFIGGHPMAGREKWGIDAAAPDLFRGAVYCLTPAPGCSPEAVSRATEMVERLGAHPLFIESEVHDYLVAGVSHLPLMLSVALTLIVGEEPSRKELWRLAATGFKDVTRLASGNPLMGRDILTTNSDKIRQWLRRLQDRLKSLERLLDDGEALREELEKAVELRERWLEERGWR